MYRVHICLYCGVWHLMNVWQLCRPKRRPILVDLAAALTFSWAYILRTARSYYIRSSVQPLFVTQ